MSGFNVEALRRWWDTNVEPDDKPYWVLHRGYGDRAGVVISNYGHTDQNMAWDALCTTIDDAISQGTKEFWIVLRPSGKNDTKGKVEFPLKVTGNTSTYGQQGGIYGVNPYQAPPAPAVDVEALTRQIEDRLTAKHELELMKMKHERQLEVMEEKIQGIAESQKSWLDQALELLDHPVIGQAIIKMLPANGPGAAAMAANIGHVPGAKRPAKAPKVYEMPAEEGDTEGETDQTQGPVIYEGLEGEYDAAILAVNILHEMEMENPGQKLLGMAEFFRDKPLKAMAIMAQIQKEQ